MEIQAHREAQIILPQNSNQGESLSTVHGLLQKELTSIFGGCTQLAAMGSWKTPDGNIQVEPVYLYNIAYQPNAERDAALLNVAACYAKLADQIVVYVRKADGGVVFVEQEACAKAA